MEHSSTLFMGMLLCVFFAVLTQQAPIKSDPCGRTTTRKVKTCRGQNLPSFPTEHLAADGESSDNTPTCYETLDLGQNKISDLNIEAVLNIPCRSSVTKLLLDHNHFSQLPPTLFDAFPNLQILDLSYNNITRIGNELCRAQNLEELTLSGNSGITFSRKAFRCNKKLKHLYINDASIRKLPKDLFHGTVLETLHLRGNPIENWKYVYLPGTLKDIIPPDEISVSSTTSSPVATSTQSSSNADGYGTNSDTSSTEEKKTDIQVEDVSTKGTGNIAVILGVAFGVILGVTGALVIYCKIRGQNSVSISRHPFNSNARYSSVNT